MRKKLKKAFAYISVLLLLTGCGSKKELAVPELIEPVAINESLRPVEKGELFNAAIFSGSVRPKYDSYFWKVDTAVSEVKVNVGDKVKKGDVLAVADLKDADNRIKELNDEIERSELERKRQKEDRELDEELFELRENAARKNKDNNEIKKIRQERKTAEENERYNKQTYEQNVSRIKKDIEEIKKERANSELVSHTDGYVTYVPSDTEYENNSFFNRDPYVIGIVDDTEKKIKAYENVVVVADYSDSVIELSDSDGIYQDSDVIKKAAEIYILNAGKKVELKKRPYDDKVLANAKLKKINLPALFELPDNSLQVGTVMPIFISSEKGGECLLCGRDSVKEDENGYFVYVKEGNEKVKRSIEVGRSDADNYEVLSGLKEGEEVYYSSSALLPEDYETKEIVPVLYGRFRPNSSNQRVRIADTVERKQNSALTGRVEKLMVESGAEVKKGDPIYTIRINEGKAELKEKKNAIENLKKDHEKRQRELDIEIQRIKDQIREVKAGQEKDESLSKTFEDYSEGASDAGEEYASEPTESEDSNLLLGRLVIEKRKLELSKNRGKADYDRDLLSLQKEYEKATKDNDGNGLVTVRSEFSGTIKKLSVREKKLVQSGEETINFDVPCDRFVAVSFRNTEDESLNLNQEIIIYYEGSGKEYRGRVSGSSSDAEREYYTIDGDRVYFTHGKRNSYFDPYGGGDEEEYTVKMEDESFFNEDGKFTMYYSIGAIENAVLIPKDAVITEKEKNSEKNYVWRIEEGNLVKQYVTVATNKEMGFADYKEHALDNSSSYSVMSYIKAGLKAGDQIAVPK